jgi:FkbM family methyltransferase
MFSSLSRLAFSRLFDYKPFRDKVIFHLRQYYYPELQFTIDLGFGLSCPIHDFSASYSFTEIFFENEYKPVFELIPLPIRWLDLGCHYGFFSLYVSWLWKQSRNSTSIRGLLVDADSRVSLGVSSLINRNSLQENLIFMYGAIASGSGHVSFNESEVMSSSLSSLLDNHTSITSSSVPIIDQHSLISHLSPPYDLVKIDTEGGEFDFFLSYDLILSQTTHLVVEWHSWHRGGGSAQQIIDLANGYGFSLLKEIQPPKPCGTPGSGQQVGVFLFSKTSL